MFADKILKLSIKPSTYVEYVRRLSDSDSFCSGSGESMNMAGFFTMASSDQPCLNLFIKSWTLDTRGKFAGACIVIFLMGLLTQFLTRLRSELNKNAKKLDSKRKFVFTVTCYGAQVTLGYLLMLAAMTYSGEIFTMVILGLTVGYGVFNLHLPPPVSTDPCCDAENEMVDDKAHLLDHAQ